MSAQPASALQTERSQLREQGTPCFLAFRMPKKLDDKTITVMDGICVSCAVATLVLVIWYQNVYVLPKVEYNKLHPYTRLAPSSHKESATFSLYPRSSPPLQAGGDTHSMAPMLSSSQ